MTRLTVSDLEIERPSEGLEIETEDGAVFVLQDPKGLRLDTLVNLESLPAADQVRALIADNKFDEFASRPEVDGYFFEALMRRYMAHYGLGSPGEGVASPSMSKGTARR